MNVGRRNQRNSMSDCAFREEEQRIHEMKDDMNDVPWRREEIGRVKSRVVGMKNLPLHFAWSLVREEHSEWSDRLFILPVRGGILTYHDEEDDGPSIAIRPKADRGRREQPRLIFDLSRLDSSPVPLVDTGVDQPICPLDDDECTCSENRIWGKRGIRDQRSITHLHSPSRSKFSQSTVLYLGCILPRGCKWYGITMGEGIYRSHLSGHSQFLLIMGESACFSIRARIIPTEGITKGCLECILLNGMD